MKSWVDTCSLRSVGSSNQTVASRSQTQPTDLISMESKISAGIHNSGRGEFDSGIMLEKERLQASESLDFFPFAVSGPTVTAADFNLEYSWLTYPLPSSF